MCCCNSCCSEKKVLSKFSSSTYTEFILIARILNGLGSNKYTFI